MRQFLIQDLLFFSILMSPLDVIAHVHIRRGSLTNAGQPSQPPLMFRALATQLAILLCTDSVNNHPQRRFSKNTIIPSLVRKKHSWLAKYFYCFVK